MADIKFSVLNNSVNTTQFKINYLKSNKILDNYNITWFAVFKTQNKLERDVTLNGSTQLVLNIPETETEFNNIVKNVKNVANKLFNVIIDSTGAFTDDNITSWYRNKEINEESGGVENSDHLLGGGIDLDFPGKINRKLFFDILNNARFKQLIWEKGSKDCPDWVHVGISLKENENRSTDYKSLPDKNTLPKTFEKRTVGFTNKKSLVYKFSFNNSKDEKIKSLIYRLVINSQYYKSLDNNNKNKYLQSIFTYFDIRFNEYGFDYISTKNQNKIIELGISGFNNSFLKELFGSNYLNRKSLLDIINTYVVNNPDISLRNNIDFFRETLRSDFNENNKPDPDDLIKNNTKNNQNNNLTKFIEAIIFGKNINNDGIYIQIKFLCEQIFPDMYNIYASYSLVDPINFSYITDLYIDTGFYDLELLKTNLLTYNQLKVKNINIDFLDGSWLKYHIDNNKSKYSINIYNTYNNILTKYFKQKELLNIDIPYNTNQPSLFN